ncbi:MAG TPA: alpha/beta hydrolase [Pyrinomonadaceae bacterium]|nr:alpha/beta hydrolase [Pyrinomonadaceae bacterium]
MKVKTVAESLLLCSLFIAVCVAGVSIPQDKHYLQQTTAQTVQVKPEGDWEGTLDAGVMKLKLVIHVVRTGEQLTATLDSPDQGATGLQIDSIIVNDGSIQLEMKSLGATYKGKFSSDGSRIEGEFNQVGQAFPLNLTRIDKGNIKPSLLRLEKVDVGGHKLNLLIGGQGSPAVIFEGGMGVGIASWSAVQKDVATFVQTVSYDRAGLSQSEPGPKPRSAKQIASELKAALQKAGVKPPYVLVGHSLGGIYVRVFADMYPKDVIGMVLIDPSQEAFNDWTRTNLRDLRKEEEARLAQAGEGIRGESESLETSYSQARAAKVPPGIKVTLISAMQDEGMPAEARKVWIQKHMEWIAGVPDGKHIIAKKSGHFVQAQEPALVIEAVRQLVKKVP